MTLGAAVANHLWQSTVVWLLLWALMPVLRQNSATVRSRLWMVASLKFLFPFALLSWAAGAVQHMCVVRQAVPVELVSATVRWVEGPFVQGAMPALTSGNFWDVPASGHPSYTMILFCAWSLGAVWVAFSWALQWMRLHRKVRSAEPTGALDHVQVMELGGITEPAVFGLFRPVLLLPRGIEQRLSSEQMEGVRAHELCHVRRRDNLQSALHMLVSALFWFHPAVWIIRTHMLRERELACDEAVLAQGGSPELYAESILSVCRWYLEAAPECMAGISGAELKDRVRRILAARPAAALNLWHKSLLLLLAGSVVALPSFAGFASPAPKLAKDRMSFEVATIKPLDKSKHPHALSYTEAYPGLLKMGGSVYTFIERGYGLNEDQILGGPNWSKNDGFDIVAKPSAPADPNQINAMLRTLLEERFKLAVHTETRDGAEYSLVAAKGGPRMKQVDDNSARGSGSGPTMLRGTMSTTEIASLLSSILGRPVLDHSGLSGTYTVDLKWAGDDQADGPSVFTAIQEQLGLKLEPTRGPIQMLVIDHVERPSEN